MTAPKTPTLTEQLAQQVEEELERFDETRDGMKFRQFIKRIRPTIQKLREEKEATWEEIAKFLERIMGHKYSVEHIRETYLATEKQLSPSEKPTKTPAKKQQKQETSTASPPPISQTSTETLPPTAPETIIEKAADEQKKPIVKRQPPPLPASVLKATGSRFH
jgi:hypothetical protein